MNVVTAMTRLWLQRPRPHRSSADAAAWYAARSALHQQIALLGGPDSEHARLLAERAHQRSTELHDRHGEQVLGDRASDA